MILLTLHIFYYYYDDYKDYFSEYYSLLYPLLYLNHRQFIPVQVSNSVINFYSLFQMFVTLLRFTDYRYDITLDAKESDGMLIPNETQKHTGYVRVDRFCKECISFEYPNLPIVCQRSKTFHPCSNTVSLRNL